MTWHPLLDVAVWVGVFAAGIAWEHRAIARRRRRDHDRRMAARFPRSEAGR